MSTTKANYTALAAFLTSYPEEVVLRRFRQLSLQNLLYYQAELAHLEQELEDIETIDGRPSKAASDLATFRWKPPSLALGSTKPPQVTSAHLYQTKFLEVRKTLTKYNEALGHYLQQEALSSPSTSTVRELRQWLDRPEFGAAFLSGSVEDVWDLTKGTKDLFSVNSRVGMTGGLSNFLLSLRRLFSLNRAADRIYSVDGLAGGFVAMGTSTVIASVLPVLPIIILFFINSLLIRLGLILVFTAIFAGLLVFGLRLAPDQVLAITTAIAAIQVVYVGSTANNNGSGTT